MPSEETILTENAFDEGDSTHEEHHHEGEIGSGESGQVAEKHVDSTRSSELVAACGREGQSGGDTEAHRHDGDCDIENSWVRYRRTW